MAYTTITATTIGLADGDTSPSPVDGTIRITPRFPAAATESGFTVSGPVIVTVTGGEMPETQIPSMEGATGVVEFHLYDRNAGPVRMPATEIPLDPDTTISLNEFMPVGEDPVSGIVFIKGETGPQGPQGEQGETGETGETGPQGETGETGPQGEQGDEGPQGETGPEGPQGEQGDQGDPGVDGTDGIDGTGIEVKDTLDSEADLPETGEAGDAYLINRDLYVWSASTSDWYNAGTLQGPKGEQGPPGVDGSDGTDGEVGSAGTDGQDGEDGATAYEVAVAEGFTGTEAEWLTSLIGPEGPAGADGADGEEGPQGPKGDDASGLPEGGEPGQVPTRTEGGGSEWSNVVDLIPDFDVSGDDVTRGLIPLETVELMVDGAVASLGSTAKPTPEAIVKRDDDGAAAFTHVTIDEPTETDHAATKAYVDDAKPSRADLVSKLEAPLIVAHRGGGKNVYPEQGLRGMIAAAESGFLPEFDIQFLKDSTPVLCHDNTVNRTMTGVTGNVSNLTKEQWRNARLNPVYKGGRDDRPLLFEDALDYLGGQAVLVPEIKKDATMDQVDTVIGLVLDRGLERAVLMQSFDYDACERIADAGMEVVYLHGTGPSVSWQTMLDAGIRYWGPNRSNATTAKMDEAASAGIRVVPYTVEEPWHATELPKSVFGYFSNDPWGNSGRFGTYGTPRWEVGEGWPARRNTDDNDDKVPGNWDGLEIWGTGLHVPRPNRLGSVSLEHLTGGFVSAPARLEATFRYLPDSLSGGMNVGFHLIRNDNDDSVLFADKAVAGQQGYTIGMRRNGTLDAWEYVNGAAASKVGTNKGASLGFIAEETESVTLTVELVGTKLTAKCITNGATFEADVSVTGSFRPYLRINSTEVLFESVSVAQL